MRADLLGEVINVSRHLLEFFCYRFIFKPCAWNIQISIMRNEFDEAERVSFVIFPIYSPNL